MFFLLLGVFLFSHPGRIDIIDGQFRFEVSKNIIDLNGPTLADYYLIQGPLPTNPVTGNHYSYYTAPPSLFPIPLMIVNRIIMGGSKLVSDEFSYSLASAFAGALIAPLLLALYRRLKIPFKQSLIWVAVFAITTLWWPGAVTTFDQCQHGIVVLAMTLTAHDAAKKGSLGSAMMTGLLAGVLLNYRVPFASFVPVYLTYWIFEGRKQGRAKSIIVAQGVLLGLGTLAGIAGYLYYNWIRFGQLQTPYFTADTPALGNPLVGFLTLFVSPGKGLLWFSPSIFLGILGIKGLFKADRGLGLLIVTLTILHVLEMSLLTFAGGDWCWGPRYMLPILPLWALLLPYVPWHGQAKKVGLVLISLGLISQLLGVSIDQHRFFFYRRLAPHFWLDQWCYFRMSQLAARPGEILESIMDRDLVRPKVNSGPQGEVTYCPFGPPRQPPAKEEAAIQATKPKPVADANAIRQQKAWKQMLGGAGHLHVPSSAAVARAKAKPPPDPRKWVKQFKIFYQPRPWWGWINDVPKKERPFNPMSFFLFCLAVTGIGTGLMLRVRKANPDNETTYEN